MIYWDNCSFAKASRCLKGLGEVNIGVEADKLAQSLRAALLLQVYGMGLGQGSRALSDFSCD